MEAAFVAAPKRPALKSLKRVLKRVIPFALAAWFIPGVVLAWVVFGLLDVLRNRPFSWATLERYFLGNGMFTWLLSPFNLLMDLLALPYTNRGVYRIEDLPPGHQAEIRALIDAAHRRELIRLLDAKLGDQKRGMIFFKWYGKNIPCSVDMPEYHAKYRHIRTIGVSIFNRRQSTDRHFGPLRVSFRFLYNINPVDDPNVFIEVGERVHRWRDEQAFIFDDTLMHRSVNQADAVRYCLFVDILRPSGLPWVMSGALAFVSLLVSPFKRVFYKNWTFLK
ncbi:MAG: aspartyl/asparaginyl beta-hydroxylase domain-containing protein [Limisphaerales bacterium]